MLLVDRALPLLDHPRASVRVPLRVSIAIAAAALALAVVAALEPVLGIPLLFPAFVGIVFMSAEVAGTSYAILTMALFGAGYVYLYVEPRRAFGLPTRPEVLVLAAYGVAGLIVAWMGGALRKAYARAREEHRAVTKMLEEREDLLRTLTHDVRTPLSAITMNAGMLTRDPRDPAGVIRRAQAIQKNAASVAGMLADLIDLAYLESGHLALDREPVDVGRFVRELGARLEGTLDLDRVRLAIPEGLPPADVDVRRFERVLVNLLSNALKYAPAPTPVTVAAAVEGREVVVSVADRGPGIARRDVPHIFEKYYRARGARTREGLGIGLYATRLLVEAHGGRIWVESVEGEGSTFHVAVPARPAPASTGVGSEARGRGAAAAPRSPPASPASLPGPPLPGAGGP